eukprot:5873861-Pyramimonas_sp.AAC.1
MVQLRCVTCIPLRSVPEALADHWDKLYTAGTATACVVGPQPLDDLERYDPTTLETRPDSRIPPACRALSSITQVVTRVIREEPHVALGAGRFIYTTSES